jgi:cytochrome c-type biogenesis protein CcmH
VIGLLAGVMYWQLGAAPDVRIAAQLDTIDENTPREQLEAVIASIEARSGQRPDNLSYLALLGRYHMSREDFASAASLYAALVERAPEDPQALAMAAQSAYLAAGRQLRPRVQELAERALAIDPLQRTALGLLEMASFEGGRYRAAISYWERLLELETPDSEGAQVLAEVIQSARARLGGEGEVEGEGETAAPPMIAAAGRGAGAAAAGSDEPVRPAAPQDDAAGIEVLIEGPEQGQMRATDTVFVLARGVDASSRMPVAVQRFTAAQMPRSLRLDDRHSMAGQKLSEAGTVRVFVQVSPDGTPGAANATFIGASEPVSAGSGSRVRIQLQPTAG